MAFGVSIKVEALFKNLQNKNRDFASQTFKVEEEAKKSKAEVNVLKKQQVEESVKLAFAVVEIEILEKKVHISKIDVTSMTKWVETSKAYLNLATEALEKANTENAAPRQQDEELNSKISGLMEEVVLDSQLLLLTTS